MTIIGKSIETILSVEEIFLLGETLKKSTLTPEIVRTLKAKLSIPKVVANAEYFNGFS